MERQDAEHINGISGSTCGHIHANLRSEPPGSGDEIVGGGLPPRLVGSGANDGAEVPSTKGNANVSHGWDESQNLPTKAADARAQIRGNHDALPGFQVKGCRTSDEVKFLHELHEVEEKVLQHDSEIIGLRAQPGNGDWEREDDFADARVERQRED